MGRSEQDFKHGNGLSVGDADPTFRYYKIRQLRDKLRSGVPILEIDGVLDQLKSLQNPEPPDSDETPESPRTPGRS